MRDSGPAKRFLTEPYSAYLRGPLPHEDAELTRVEGRAAAGELLRRYWQPVALSSELGELPMKVRLFGEDLVLFRTTAGQVGLLELHCSHRGTSLEFGICEASGLRCCYHGWLYGVDGRVLQTPGDPPESTLRFSICHGAYPALEYRGLVFGYFGPPDKKPAFPVYDSYALEGDRLVPYYITYPCNWLQVHENVMDPAHAVFLHTRISYSHFADAWGELPAMDFVATPAGMIYVTARRWQDNVWVRSNDILLPNIAQVGHIWEDGSQAKEFARVAITRWTTPVDDHTCRIIGWRHFHPDADPRGIADERSCGPESVDFVGQTGARSYAERQRVPGDYDAQVSQRPIAVHGLENLTRCDRGVAMLRQLLKRRIRAMQYGQDPGVSPLQIDGRIPTYCHDTVLNLPRRKGVAPAEDLAFVAQVGREVTEIVVQGAHQSAPDRQAQIRSQLRALAGRHGAALA